MDKSVSFSLPMGVPSPLNDPTVVATVNTIDSDALWDQFDKFYKKNEKAIEKCINTDVRAMTLDEKVSEIELQIDRFSETMTVVLDGLAGLGKIHPIIGVAVVAFHAVISLDLSRRDNDRKVIAVMLDMQSMMCAMFQLRHLKYTHIHESGRDAETTGLHQLIESITKDIKQCGSDLNYYLDQKFAFRLIKAKNFEQRFKVHVDNFAKRRSELQSTIAVYIAGGVARANVAITAVSTKLDNVDTKLNHFFEAVLRKLDTPQEKEALRFLEQNNGIEKCISKDELLALLLAMTGDVLPESENQAELKPDERIKRSRKVLTNEMHLDFEESLKQNTFRFARLLTVQNNNHERVIAQLEKQEGYHKVTMSKLDKLLYYMHPDTKLNDPEVRRIWERMGLKTSVKAKTFVLTFRDHYQPDFSALPTSKPTADASPPFVDATTGAQSLPLFANFDQPNPSGTMDSEDPNAWVLEYIDMSHVRPIVEAIDADRSGFISVTEINTFARARPKEWSLLEWMVYWAAGWHINITQYRDKIYDILIQMHELVPLLHPANRVFVDAYVDSYPVTTIEPILRSTKNVTYNPQSQIAALAQFYAQAQESALRTNLKEVSYVISSMADATLVAGPDRAESWIYPLLYLLLEHHLAVLKLGMTQVFNDRETFTHEASLYYVLNVFYQRMDSLTAVFSQIDQNVASRFETFAYGMFYSYYKKDTEFTPANYTLLEVRVKRPTRELLLEMRNKSQEPAVLGHVLALKRGNPFEFEDLNVYGSATVKTDLDLDSHPLEGYWSVVCFDSDDNLLSTLGLFHFVLSVKSDGSITGSGEAYVGKLWLQGTTAPLADRSLILFLELKMIIESTKVEYLFHGAHNATRDVVTGSWEQLESYYPQENPPTLNTFSMRRTPADMRRFRRNLRLDSETESFVLTKHRWKFAIEATKFQVQSKMFSWDYVRARFAERRLWLDLAVALREQAQPQDCNNLICAMTGEYAPWHSRLYEAIAQYLHPRDYKSKSGQYIICDYCGQKILCNRYRCITCIRDDMSDQIDLCTHTPKCIENASRSVYPENNLIYYSSFLAHCRARSENVKKMFRTLEKYKKTKEITKVSKSRKSEYDLRMEEAANFQPLRCVCCEKEVSLPCWVCATCATETAVCLECELKRAKIVKYDNWVTMHSHDHHLLRINDSVEVQSGEVDNVRLQRELVNITTDLKSLEQKLTTHLRAASKVNTALRRFTSDGKVTKVTRSHGAPVRNEEAEATTTTVARDTVNEEEDDDISDIFGSNHSSDTESETLAFAPEPPPPADSQPLFVSADAEASVRALAIAPSPFETDARTVPDAVQQEVPDEASIGTPTPASAPFFEAADNKYTSAPQAEPESLEEIVPVGPSAPTSKARRFAQHIMAIDTRISSIDSHISSLDSRFSSLDNRIDTRISALENRLIGVESQLGEILSLLRQDHS